jgi:hypothetical protein
MDNHINLILSVLPENLAETEHLGFDTAHMIYKISPEGFLYRADCPYSAGGVMVLDISALNDRSRVQDLVDDTFYELKSRNYSGLLIDCAGAVADHHRRYTAAIEKCCLDAGKALFACQNLAESCQSACILISSAISGGTLSGRLRQAKKQYGSIALEIDISLVDFTLPSPSGQGKELSLQQLNNLRRRYHCQGFFSSDLCAHYFTYRADNKTHFVLYDNRYSVERKLLEAEKEGVRAAFIFYPHVKNIVTELARFRRHG